MNVFVRTGPWADAGDSLEFKGAPPIKFPFEVCGIPRHRLDCQDFIHFESLKHNLRNQVVSNLVKMG